MITLIETVGGVDSNSYVSLDEANTYFEYRSNSDTWNNITDDEEKKRLLITATRIIDYEKFDGSRVNLSQSLAFPRINLPLVDGIDIDNIIPKAVKEATFELAIHLKNVDMSKQSTQQAPIESVKAGSVEVKYKFDKGDNLVVGNQDLPPFVKYLLEPFSITVSSSSGVFMAFR